jgi:nucleoside-diphosphate-sugar epimerase
MARRSERVLITGASGLTGRLLLQRLQAESVEVFAMRRSPKKAWEVRGDLNDAPSLHDAVRQVHPTHVLHLGGITFPAHADQTEIYQTNVIGTAALLTALKDHAEPVAVILPSSATVYAPPLDDTPIVESAPLLPGSHYAVSKLTLEHMARLFGRDMPITITRPFNYTGAGQPNQFLIPKIVDHFARGERVIELGNLDLYRDFSDVRTVVDAYMRMLAAPRAGDITNLCSGRRIHLKSILSDMAQIAGYEIEVKVNPAFARAGEPPVIVGSTRHMDEVLGPLRSPPLIETLAWMYESQLAAART